MWRLLPEELGLFMGSSRKPGEKKEPLPAALPQAGVSRRQSGKQEPAPGFWSPDLHLGAQKTPGWKELRNHHLAPHPVHGENEAQR